jgi:hypothetical protein
MMIGKLSLFTKSGWTTARVSLFVVIMSMFLSSASAWAQQPVLVLEPKAIVIGQQAQLTIQIEVPLNSVLVWPGIADTLTKHIEIVSFGRPDTLSRSSSSYVLQQVHQITAWSAGFFPIPPLVFTLIQGEERLEISSDPLLLEVMGVEVDMEADIHDIKPIFGVPVSFRELLPYILGVIGLALLVWVIYYIISKRKKTVTATPTIWEKPDIPAHVAAISALENLKSKKLWQAGQVKLYHSELTDILRMYLEKRYAMHAMEMTSSEIMFGLHSYLSDELLASKFREVLELADLVKFAKYKPDNTLHDRSMELAFDFVMATKIASNDVQ